jgi:hypothetical protein
VDQQAENYWVKLSAEDRLKLLLEYDFWQGFSTYLWDYIPEDLRTIIRLKIDCNALKHE